MSDRAVSRASIGVVGTAVAVALACALLSLDRGLDLTDESSYLYLLAHPDVVAQFIDHRLWGTLGASVAGYRLLALLLTTASAAFLAAGAVRALGLGRGEALFVQLATLAGALGYFAVVRPTMNYGTTGLVFGNLFVGLLLHDLARSAGRRLSIAVPVLLGAALAVLALGRITAVVPYLVMLVAFAVLRAGPRREQAMLVAGTLVSLAAMVVLLIELGLPLDAMVGTAAGLAGASHRLSAFVPRDLMLIALMVGAGAAGAAAVRLGGRLGVSRSLVAVGFAGLVIAAAVLDHRAVLASPEPGASPFVNNVAAYGTTYAFFVLGAMLAWLVAFDEFAAGREGWRRHARWWGVLSLLALACPYPFLGTNMGLLARSGSNAGPLFAGIAVAALACARRGLLAGWSARTIVAGAACLAAFWVFLNTIWAPHGVNGGWSRQTVLLTAPASVAGQRVSPAMAALSRDLRAGLARTGFDPARDRLLFGYNLPGLAVLAGGEVAGLPFAPEDESAQLLFCSVIVRKVAAVRPRRLYGLNLDYKPELRRCLSANGMDLSSAKRVRVSPHVTITVLPLS